VTERKPAGVSFETWVDAQIREANERGEFENLPGFGKPLPDLTGDHDEMWWIRNFLKRENIGFTPPAIALRKAAEDLLASLDRFPTERGLRAALEELNERIRVMNRSPVFDGPPSNMMPLDVEPLVARWGEARAAREAQVEVAPLAPVAPMKRRWFRRTRS
jgi:DnaJ-like protein